MILNTHFSSDLSSQGNLRPRRPPCEYLGKYTSRGKPKIPPADSHTRRRSGGILAVVNSSLVDDPTVQQPAFDLPQWSLLNEFRAA